MQNLFKRQLAEIYLRLETVNGYSSDYHACTAEAKTEYENNTRPELKAYLKDISGYDNIFICGPCWCGTYPMAVFSLIESLNFQGKNVMPLMTHEGSGLGTFHAGYKPNLARVL